MFGKVESLAVRNESNIASMKDLMGKKIVTPFASTAHYSLLNALKFNGISEKDVELLDDLVTKYVKALNKGVNLYKENQDEAVKTI